MELIASVKRHLGKSCVSHTGDTLWILIKLSEHVREPKKFLF